MSLLVPFILILSATPGRVTGRATECSGRTDAALAEVTISFVRAGAPRVVTSVRTNADGTYAVELPAAGPPRSGDG